MKISDKKRIAAQATIAAGKVRNSFGKTLIEPISIFDLIQDKVELWFQDIPSLEGMYFKNEKPVIILSSLRPLVRKAYTAAHEYAHDYFGHGTTVDDLEMIDKKNDPKEYIADCFASSLLMTKTGICNAFSIR